MRRSICGEFGGAIGAPCEVLTIGLVNNMPDSALRATERQFCALLGAASEGRLLKLQFYSLPGIKRSAGAHLHISRYYEAFAELERSPPDGIIVTGTEPQAPTLQQEPYWKALARLVDWADERAIPSVWSCLAAHAAVLRLDNIERHALCAKMFGLFECQVNSAAHPILQGLPENWRVPHSRLYGLSESALNSRGYTILSHSAQAGPDIFVRRKRGLQLFFQGHPEYTPASLIGEYRRDIARFLSGERNTYPELPRHYCGPVLESELARFAERAREHRDADLLTTFDELVAGAGPSHSWFQTANRIYANWLSYLEGARSRRALPTGFSKDRAGAIHLVA